MKNRLLKSTLLLLTAASAGLVPVAQAASDYWTNTPAGIYNWNANSNWLSGTGFPNGIGNDADLTKDIAGVQTNNLNVAITLGTLRLGDSATAFFTRTINAGTAGSLTFNSATTNGLLIQTNKNTTDVINANVTLNTNLTVSLPWLNNGTGIRIFGQISGVGGVTTVGQGYTGGNVGQYLWLANPANNFTGDMEVNNTVVQWSGNVIKGQPSSFGSSTNAVRVGGSYMYTVDGVLTNLAPNSAAATAIRLVSVSDTTNYVFTRDLDFSATPGATTWETAGLTRFYFDGDNGGGANSNVLTMGGVITTPAGTRPLEILVAREGQMLYITNDIVTGANGGSSGTSTANYIWWWPTPSRTPPRC